MNFLAHFHLAWPDDGLITGALEGDYLKGPLRGQRAAEVEAGIRLHRQIDAFTDNHPVVVELRRAFPTELRRFAGIVIDLGFDHCLTRHWDHYSDVPLRDFARSVYGTLEHNCDELSESARDMLGRLIQYDILCAYGDWAAVTGSAHRVGERFKRGNPLVRVAEFDHLKELVEDAFHRFYPELVEVVADSRTRCLSPAGTLARPNGYCL